MLTSDRRFVRLFAVLLMILLCQNASAVTVIFEAEDANNDENAGTFYNVIAGYSGTGYMLLDGAFGAGLDFTVNVRDASDYPLTLRYHSPFGDKIQEIWVNDVKVDQHNFTQTTMEEIIPDNGEHWLNEAAYAALLASAWQREQRPVRLLGAGLRLEPLQDDKASQLLLFEH